MASSAESENGNPGFQIAPMVDVVFVLMLFFMASAGMRMREMELPIKLPGTGESKSPPIVIVIVIGSDGRVSINEKTYGTAGDKSLGDLRKWLTGVITQFGIEEAVIIRPASDVRHERIMQVLNATAASGVGKVTFG